MHTMKTAIRLLSIAVLALLVLSMNKPVKESWVYLFDGKTLKGWVQKGGSARYEVRDRTITGYAVPNTPNSFLCTEKEYSNFILELEVKVDTIMNSGIQIRSHSRPDYKNGVVHGYQVEIDPSPRAWSGGLYEEQGRGWLQDLKDKPEAGKAFNKYGWNQYRIEAIGPHFRTWVNGVACTNFTDSATAAGFIALQVHSIGKKEELERQAIAPLQVQWRKIRIREK